MRTFISRFCITIGILLILSAGGLTAYNLWDSYRADSASQEIIAEIQHMIDEGVIDSEIYAGVEETAEKAGAVEEDQDREGQAGEDQGSEKQMVDDSGEQEIYELYPEVSMPTVMIGGYNYIGILSVPYLSLNLPIMDEWDYSRLKISPCRYWGSVYTNNLVIAGHNYLRHFTPLKSVPIGTLIIFTDMAGNQFRYKVSAIETIQPTNVAQMVGTDLDESASSNSWDLTLFTCTTGGSARCAIRCVRTN